MGILDNYKGLPREIYIITLCKFINRLGFFVFAFLTLFLTKKMGLSVAKAGYYTMLTGIVQVPGTIIGGFLSDKIGRKRLLVTFQFLAGLTLLPCAWLGNSMMIPKLLIISSGFNGVASPVSSAMVTDLTTPENRKQCFSLLYLGANLGIAFGTFLAGVLFYSHTKWLFIGDFLTTAISVALVVIYIKETKPSEEEMNSMDKESDESIDKGNAFVAMAKRPILFSFVLVSSIFSFIYAQHAMALPLQLTGIYGENLGSKLYGIIMPINALVVVIATPFVTIMTKKIKPILNISIGGLLYAIGFGAIYFAKDFSFFVITTIIWTMGEVVIAIYNGVYVANHTPISHRGRFNSIIPLITGGGYVMSMRVMSSFIDKMGLKWVWSTLFWLGLVGATLMFVLFLAEEKRVLGKSKK